MRGMDSLLQDLRFARRNLAKSPGFTVTAVLSLALGIGAATAIFSVIYGVVLRPFPYLQPETLFSFGASEPDRSFYFYPGTPDQFLEIAARNHVFSDLIASTISDIFWTGTGRPQRLRGNFVTVNTFRVMGVSPLLGRYIVPTDGEPEAEPVVVLGYKFWMRQFGGDPRVVGTTTMRLNDKVRTVVGVMPKRFMWRGADVYIPIVFQRGQFVEGVHQAFFMGRLHAGMAEAQGRADLYPILEDMITRERGQHVPKFRVQLDNFYETFPSGIRKSLWILFGAVSLLLLLACTNVSSLLLARAAARTHEIAIRGALGASHLRIVRQLLTESALLGMAAAIIGALLAWASLRGILAIVPPDTIPDESEVVLNVPVLVFTLGISLIAAFLFGLAPALQAARTDFASALKSTGRGVNSGFGEARVRNIFVVAQVALAIVLLASASLVLRTLLQLDQFHVGVQPENVLTMTLPLQEQHYATVEARNSFLMRLLDRVRAIPAMREVSLNSFVHPFANFGTAVSVPASPMQSNTGAIVSQISSSYPRMLGLPLQGRSLTEADVRSGRHYAMVNETFAKFYFPHGSAIGQIVELSISRDAPRARTAFEIVAVAGDLRNRGLRREIMPEVYVPFTATGFMQNRAVALMATANMPVRALANAIEAQVRDLDPDQPVMEVRTMREMLDDWGYAEPRFSVFLFSMFAGIGLLLAALGVYAIMNYSAVRRTQEVGLRMALGARRGAIAGMILRSGAKLLGFGAIAGVAGSLCLTRLLRSMIFGVSPFDPVSFAIAIGVMLGIGLFACLLPAVRAARLDPMVALRYE
jgi:putative ABC transport system permease protein